MTTTTTRTRRTHASHGAGGIVAQLRAQLTENVKACPTCGATQGQKAKMARDLGVTPMTLNKFLKGGRTSSDMIDKVYTYLEAQKENGEG